MKAFILDCSVTMTWCFDDESNKKSDEALELLRKVKAIVPPVWSLEVINVLSIAERKKRIKPSESQDFIDLLASLPIEIDMGFSGFLNKEILEISRKYSISAYDASYLELSSRKHLALCSFDKVLCEAAKMAGLEVM